MEQRLRKALGGLPGARRLLRRSYQRAMYLFSKKVKSEGALRRATPADGGEWFFGYYDKSPWDLSGLRFLALRADAVNAPAPDAVAELYLIENGRFRKFAETRTWNAQQGCMLQWLGPDFKSRVLYNDFRDGKYVSVAFDVDLGREVRVYPMPVYAVSADGKTALTLDFSRLHRLRPGYGYSNLADLTAGEPCPESPCVWKMNLETGETAPILTYSGLRAFEEKASMGNAVHKINHIMINPSGTRFMALHRWFEGNVKHTRLLTFDMDGNAPFTLADEDFVSHCNWLSDEEIVSFCRLGGADGYYALTDKTLENRRLWPSMTRDGHMSQSAAGLMVADTYPDRARMQSVYVMDGEKVTRLARVFSPFQFDGDIRCDLHPRFDRLGGRIMIDATFEGRRAMYELPARETAPVPRVLTVVSVPMAFDGPTMSTLRYARSMDPAQVSVDYVAINDPPREIRDEILGLGGRLFTVPRTMRNPFSYVFRLARIVRRGKYQVVHAHGNSCTLALEMLGAALGGAKVRVAHSENSYCKYLTAHRLLRPLFDLLYTDAYACGADAGKWLFGSHPFSVARISVETEKYAFNPAARAENRRALGVDGELLVGCVAHFTPHKNHAFLLEMFASFLTLNPAAKLALVGDGALRPEVEKKIASLGIEKSVLLLGVRTDVPALLSAFDVMVLPSLWEGFPNVLVEWQCAGLRTLVSDTVTREARLTGLVDYLPIHSAAPWVESLVRFVPPADRERVSAEAVDAVRAAGYDIRENARGMQEFYREAARRCPR